MRKVIQRMSGRAWSEDDSDRARGETPEGARTEAAEVSPSDEYWALQGDDRADRASEPATTHAQGDDTGELGADYAQLGEHVASVLQAARAAAEKITEEARQEAGRVQDGAREEATAILAEANRAASSMLSEADHLRAEAESKSAKTRDEAEAYAAEKRRDADAEASSLIAGAEQAAKHHVEAEARRKQALAENIEVTEKRLRDLVAGLRELAARLEDLVHPDAESALREGAPGDRTEGDTLDEALKASVATGEANGRNDPE
jgi:hypothetical protein